MQEFLVVQCYSCNQYQVSQKRKDKKFKCKVCGSSQSVRTVAARSHRAAQLRPIVQQANLRRGEAEQRFEDQNQQESASDHSNAEDDRQDIQTQIQPVRSRWTLYVNEVSKRSVPKKQSQNSDDEQIADHDPQEEPLVTSLPDIPAEATRHAKRARNPQRQADHTAPSHGSGFVQNLPDSNTARGESASHATPPSKRSRWAYSNAHSSHVVEEHGSRSWGGATTWGTFSSWKASSVWGGNQTSLKAPSSTARKDAARAQTSAQREVASGGMLTCLPGDVEIHEESLL